MSDADVAQLIAGTAILVTTAGLAYIGRKDLVATTAGEYTRADGTRRKVHKGEVIPRGDAAGGVPPTKEIRRSVLGAMIVGKDHRTSTSKTVVFLWTLAVAFGLLSLLVAMWLGDAGPWDAQVKAGLRPEYLLLLGGPFAAAILAKTATAADADTKTTAPVGEASTAQLVNDDEGNTELGDFQYLLFNLIALAFFFGAFIGDLSGGFPVLPELLTGLVLTSTAGYAAKKFLERPAPTLLSVVPAAAQPGQSVEVFGTNLAVSSGTTDAGAALLPIVLVGQLKSVVTAQDAVLGNDRLTVVVPSAAQPGTVVVSAVRADGVTATTASGTNTLAFEVLA